MEIKCPHCGSEDINLREKVFRYYTLSDEQGGDVLHFDGDNPEECSEDVEFFCDSCYQTFDSEFGFDII